MAMKEYFILPTIPEVEPHHQINFSVILRCDTKWFHIFFYIATYLEKGDVVISYNTSLINLLDIQVEKIF